MIDRDKARLTPEKREMLRKAMGSVPSKIDFNRVRDYLKCGEDNMPTWIKVIVTKEGKLVLEPIVLADNVNDVIAEIKENCPEVDDACEFDIKNLCDGHE